MDASRFRFNIGESVKYIGAPGKYENRILRYMIVGRLAEECIGGVQYHYRVRPYNPGVGGDKDILQFLEFEVEAIPEGEADPVGKRVDDFMESHRSKVE